MRGYIKIIHYNTLRICDSLQELLVPSPDLP